MAHDGVIRKGGFAGKARRFVEWLDRKASTHDELRWAMLLAFAERWTLPEEILPEQLLGDLWPDSILWTLSPSLSQSALARDTLDHLRVSGLSRDYDTAFRNAVRDAIFMNLESFRIELESSCYQDDPEGTRAVLARYDETVSYVRTHFDDFVEQLASSGHITVCRTRPPADFDAHLGGGGLDLEG
jgi:hypothetical protein